jgi:cardiolipin-specific phospholipase
MPLLARVQDKLKCPSVWIYGDNGWMHTPSGFEAANIMNRIGRRDLFAEFHVVPKAGHHVYLNNVGKFNSVVLNFINRKV